MQLTKDSIINASIEILDEYGLADMTMRRVAKRLSVAPGALYWHIPNKQALIAAIANRIIEPAAFHSTDDGTHDWRTAVATTCRSLRGAMQAHRDGAEVVIAALSSDSALRLQLEQLIGQALGTAPLADQERHDGALTLLYFVTGATLSEQTATQLAEATGTAVDAPADRTRVFNCGIDLILAGLEAKGS
ncbi:TetR/AcrR family transcriptional regulator C-terminal domain-containing protein [Corynebacterium sp.]|uniref:TetR/AcrR family transcriptional regulator C-terminal domain-containing protein n=1 Tax=Corynebacterium sp. TaxID=1720 RepID=UPI0026DC2D1B|nr:TetR/AcrR family transcriptional regulator C-terminal domain-containing protein [Corynebacterium sp.]MDO5075885.1 TetR/AcrR family transcriptional regulator C-terminal domain-containing protein [Corynebacterium sp.]